MRVCGRVRVAERMHKGLRVLVRVLAGVLCVCIRACVSVGVWRFACGCKCITCLVWYALVHVTCDGASHELSPTAPDRIGERF
jgi:hypothetical protein